MKYILIILTLFSLSACSWTLDNWQNTNTWNTIKSVQLQPIYLDVREDNEWTEWHVDGAIHVKLWDIESGKFDNIPKDRPVRLYCRSWRRSAIAYDILSKAWYLNITDMWWMSSLSHVKIVK